MWPKTPFISFHFFINDGDVGCMRGFNYLKTPRVFNSKHEVDGWFSTAVHIYIASVRLCTSSVFFLINVNGKSPTLVLCSGSPCISLNIW